MGERQREGVMAVRENEYKNNRVSRERARERNE